MSNKLLTIIGTNHGKAVSRIWIEGKRLVEAGFTVGARYDRVWDSHTSFWIILRLDPDGRYKVSGKGERLIIDTSGKVVREVFPDSGDNTERQVVEVTFKPGVITMRRPGGVK